MYSTLTLWKVILNWLHGHGPLLILLICFKFFDIRSYCPVALCWWFLLFPLLSISAGLKERLRRKLTEAMEEKASPSPAPHGPSNDPPLEAFPLGQLLKRFLRGDFSLLPVFPSSFSLGRCWNKDLGPMSASLKACH